MNKLIGILFRFYIFVRHLICCGARRDRETKRATKIVSVGRYVPSKQISNAELLDISPITREQIIKIMEHVSETKGKTFSSPEDYIAQTYGITSRHWCNEHETVGFIGAKAAEDALAKANMTWNDIDYVIATGPSQEHMIPDNAVTILNVANTNRHIPCSFVHTSCSGFLTSLHVANAFIKSETYKRIMIITTDSCHNNIDPTDPKSFCIMGSMATATIVETTSDNSKIIRSYFETHPKCADIITVKMGVHSDYESTVHNQKENLFYMNGKKVIEETTTRFGGFLMSYAPDISNLKYVVPHQPSKIAIDHLKVIFTDEKLWSSFESYGNTISSAIPNNLYELIESGNLDRNDEILLIGAGAGLHFGAIQLVY